MRKLFTIISIFLGVFTTIEANSQTTNSQVALAWDANCDTNLAGYNIRWGLTTATPSVTNVVNSYVNDCGNTIPSMTNIYFGIYTNIVFVPGITNNGVAITGLLPGTAYAFTVTTTNAFQGLESQYSSEVVYVVPQPSTNTSPAALQGFIIQSITPN